MKTKMFKNFFLMVLVVMMTISMSIPTNAATKYGYGFASKPITIYASNLLSAMEVEQLQQAITVWNGTRVGTVFVYGGKTSLLSYYFYSDGKNGVVKGDLGNKVNAMSHTKTNGSNITEADISLNTKVTYNNGSTTSGTYYLKSVYVHELGHVLGLADINDSSSVMCSWYTGMTALSVNDINDLDSLY